MTSDTMAPTASKNATPKRRRTGPGRPRLEEGRRSVTTTRETLVREWCAETDTSLRGAARLMDLTPQALDHAMKSTNPHSRTIHRFLEFFHANASKKGANKGRWSKLTISDITADIAVAT